MPSKLKRTVSQAEYQAVRQIKKAKYGKTSRRSSMYRMLALPETKVVSSYSTTGAYTADTANSHIVTAIAAGDSADQREGMRIFPQWLRIRNQVLTTTANAPSGANFRRIVWIDWAYNGTTISPLETVGTHAGISNLYKGRAQILKDDLIPVSSSEPIASDLFIDLTKYYTKPGRQYVQYTGTGTADGTTGTIFVWYLFSSNIADGGFRYTHQLAFKP